MSNNISGSNPTVSPTKANQNKHSPVHFSDSLFRNKKLKQKRLKWQLAISKTAKPIKKRNKVAKTEPNRRSKSLMPVQPEITINLLSDDDEEMKIDQKPQTSQQQQLHHSLPQIIVFPSHMQLSKVPNITLIPVQTTTTLQNHLRRKRKSQKPKRHAEPTIVNKESIVLSDESNLSPIAEVEAATEKPATCSTPNQLEISNSLKSTCPPPLSYFDGNHIPNAHHNENSELKISAVHSTATAPQALQVDEEVTVSLVPRSAAGSCSSKITNTTELFPIVPDETTVQTIISNRIYELSLSKLREGLATSGAAEFADEKQQKMTQLNPQNTKRKGTTFNLPPTLKQPNRQPVSLKLSSDLSISLISDDEDDPQQQRINAESILRQQPHLSVRPVGIAPIRQPPKRRKLG